MSRFPRPLLAPALAVPALAQTVTATAKVRIDGKVETVRKINNRWWSEDNRHLTPTKEGYIWWLSSEKGKSWDFHHHRPVDLPTQRGIAAPLDVASRRPQPPRRPQ